MKIEIVLKRETISIITEALQGVYTSKAYTRIEKSNLSIALDVMVKFEAKSTFLKSNMNLFDAKKLTKISLKYHEGNILESLLLAEIKEVNDEYKEQKIQKVIDQINQKLA